MAVWTAEKRDVHLVAMKAQSSVIPLDRMMAENWGPFLVDR